MPKMCSTKTLLRIDSYRYEFNDNFPFKRGIFLKDLVDRKTLP